MVQRKERRIASRGKELWKILKVNKEIVDEKYILKDIKELLHEIKPFWICPNIKRTQDKVAVFRTSYLTPSSMWPSLIWRENAQTMGMKVGEETLYSLQFADDQMLIAEDEEDLAYMLRKLVAEQRSLSPNPRNKWR